MSVATLAPAVTMGADIYWDGSDGTDWATPANWVTNAVPGAADKAFINNITVNTPSVTASTTISELLVGFAGTTGTVNVSAGTLAVNSWGVIGNGTGGNGTLNLTGSGSLNKTNTVATSNFYVGEAAGSTGIVNINTSGSFTSAREVVVGYNSGTGTLNLQAGTMTVNNVFRVGSTGSGSNGTVNYTGGALALNNAVRFGAATNAITDVNIGSGTIANVSSAGTVRMGEGAGSNNTLDIDGTFNMLSTSSEGSIRIGHNSNTTTAANTVNVKTGGILYSEGDMIHGYSGNTGSLNTLNIDGGSVKVASTITRWMKIGNWDGQNSVTNITNGGSLKLNTNTNIKMGFTAGVSGTHTINVDGGSIIGYIDNGASTTNASATIDMSYVTNTMSAALNIKNGGLVQVRAIFSNNNNTSAVVNFDNGTLRATGDDLNFIRLNGTGTRQVNLLAGGGTIDSNGYNVTIGNALSGVGALTKAGGGILTLSGANTYTGATLVNGGTLSIGSIDSSSSLTINGVGAKVTKANYGNLPATALTQGTLETNAALFSLNVANSATNTLSPGAGTTSPMLVQNGLTFQGAAVINTKANGAYMENYVQPTIDSTLALNTPGDGAANGQVVVNSTNISTWSGGTNYPIVEYSTFSGSINDFVLGTVSGLSPRQTASLVDTGAAIALHIDGDSIRWTGDASSNWTTTAVGFPFNWILPSSSSSTEYLSGDVVLFDDNATNFSVNIAENVSPGSVVFNNTTDFPYTVTGSFGINGGSIIKNNSGTVVLATNNSYTGTTTINAGTLQIGNGGASGSISASSTIANNGELVINTSSAGTYANPITGTGNLTKSGTGTLTLSGANTFTGNFTLNGGQLNLNNAAALGAGPGTITLNTATLNNTSGAVLNLAPNKNVALNSDLTFLGSNNLFLSNGAVTINATRTFDIQAGIFGCGLVGDLAAGHSLIKTGTGTLVLNGGNITGNLDIQNGIVGLNQDFHGAAFIGTGILQNAGNVGTKWTFWYGPSDVTTNTLIRNNDTSHTMQLGIVKRGSGTLSLTNASNNATANLSVDSGKLVLNGGTYGARNDDGSTNTGLTAIVGNTAAANGVLEINGATVNYNNRSAAGTDVWRSTLNVGNNGTGAGAVKFNSGTLTTDKQLALGITGTAFGAMTQTGGSASIGGFLALGLGTSQGVFNQTGGMFTLTTGPVTNGAGAGSVGVINLSGSAVYNHNSAANNAIWIGEAGTGILNVSGSAALTLPTNGVELGRNNVATASGTLNLLGGTVTTNYVSKPGAAATGRLNFNGGTLAANVASATFLTGLTSARVHSGGGSISNGGNAITIGQALEAPTGNGVSASGLVASGSGFIDTPLVTITGDGTGATAVANVDSSGNLTGIVITNPGVGYTTPPTFTLSGGGIGNTGSITGSATLVPNTSGGMTFSGAAVTTLTGVNTYSGNTTINSGTVVVTNGAALTVAPTTNGVSTKITGAGAITLQGSLRVLLSGANQTNGNSWTLVDATTRTYDSTFKVSDPVLGDFTAQGDGVTHTLVDGTKTWTYSETSGTLSLSIVSAGYSSWITGFGLGAGDQDPTDDPDGDGFNNLMEYVLGGNPNSSNTSIAPTGSKSGSNFIFTFNRNDTAVSGADVAISLEYGNDLVGWTSVAVPASSGAVSGVAFTIANGSPNDTVTASIPTSSAAKFFARVKAVK